VSPKDAGQSYAEKEASTRDAAGPSRRLPDITPDFDYTERKTTLPECIMSESNQYIELHCRACGWREVCGPDAVAGWLRTVGKLRPGRQPEREILHELLLASASQLICPDCQAQGLHAAPASDDSVSWPDVVLCEACQKPIPRERVEALPGVTFCASCQNKIDRGEEPSGAVEYCPRCGAPMEVRLARTGGMTRYVMACTNNPPCQTQSRSGRPRW
jgi:predicted amidophosphoribosyltransferase